MRFRRALRTANPSITHVSNERLLVSRPRILLDCDGVLSAFIDGVLEVVHLRLGRNHTVDEIQRYDFAKELKLTAEEKRLVTEPISNSRTWWQNLPVLKGAQEGFRQLVELGEIYIVTAPWDSNPTWEYQRKTWLKKHFDIPVSHVIPTHAKHLIAGDVFVDDKVENVYAWQAEFRGGLGVLWNTPHNQHDGFSGPRTHSWERLAGLIESRQIYLERNP